MKHKSSVNYGIQAENIQANAIAVGPHAHATATAASEQEAVLGKLTDAIRQLQLSAAQQQSILDHIDSMKTEAAPQRASTFDKIVAALKEVGHAAELVSPLKAVAAAFGLPLPF